MAEGPGSSEPAQPSPRATAAPRLAATVVLLRERGVPEVLFTKRSADMHFMGSVWVFPGGKLDPADRAPGALGRVRLEEGAPPARLRSPEDALGLTMAACRETFEEVGLLLARAAGGGPCTLADVERLQPLRAESGRRPAAFQEMLEREELYLSAGDMILWSNWITPSASSVRFDTWFFVAAAPEGQEPWVDASESTRHVWLSPAEALRSCDRGEITFVPPTLLTVRELAESVAEHRSVASLLRAEARRALPPVLPKVRIDEEGRDVVLPWDPEYGALEGEGVPADTRYPPGLCRQGSRVRIPRENDRDRDGRYAGSRRGGKG